MGIRVRVIRFQVIGEANTWLEGQRTEKKEENVSVTLVTFWGQIILSGKGGILYIAGC